MIRWLPFERRWLARLLEAMVPAHRGLGGFAALPDDERVRAADLFERAAPPLLALGVRAATWALTLSPLVLVGRFATFGGLDEDTRDTLLARAMKSPSYLVRQLVLTLKLVACFEYLESPAVRAALAPPPDPSTAERAR